MHVACSACAGEAWKLQALLIQQASPAHVLQATCARGGLALSPTYTGLTAITECHQGYDIIIAYVIRADAILVSAGRTFCVHLAGKNKPAYVIQVAVCLHLGSGVSEVLSI